MDEMTLVCALSKTEKLMEFFSPQYGEEEDLNAQSLKERGYSRENSTGSQIENGDEEEE
jgi:hypothetical protein